MEYYCIDCIKMDLNAAFNSTVPEVVGNTFQCAKKECRKTNIILDNVKQQTTYTCKFCNSFQYCGGNRMFLGKDAFTLEIDSQAEAGYF